MGAFRGVKLDDLVLTGPRIQLRPWHPSDAPRVVEVMADDRMHGYLSLPRPYTDEHAQAFVASANRARAEASALECAVVETATDRVVGACALRFGREPDIGYWVATDAQGHGYAAEAARVLAGWGFATGLRRIALMCSVGNLASATTALAAGFAFEGIARGGFADEAHDGVPAREGSMARFARLASDDGRPIPPVLPRITGGVLSDGELALRLTTPADADGLIETDDEVTLRWSFDGVAHPEARWRAVATEAGLNWLVGRSGLLSMVEAATGTYAGQVTIRQVGPPGVCALGYVVHPAFRGRGYTTKALRLVVDWAFTQGGVSRLELGAKVGNVASQQAARHAGFEYEGVMAGRLRAPDGSFHDEAGYALLNPRTERRG